MPRKFAKSFSYAWNGLCCVARTQRNFWIHGAIGLGIVALALGLGLPRQELAIILAMCTLVLAMEVANTGVEFLVDVLCPQHDPRYGRVKDIMAGAVLLSALGSVAVGLTLLARPLWDALQP
ncbi:MAG: diacylglycerol kinase family protein [Desulfovibrio sp.]|nr:diacylglycerol kinase family protein [Desulfovibrio sp.]MCA1987384.1 diacylglycerol kinase family protein [Desulfovibrio sp.]